MLTPTQTRVLVAHSDPLIATGLTATLREQGLEVIARAMEAVVERASASFTPAADVAITDYESGLRLLRAGVRSRQRVVILTHRDGEAEICHALEQGADGYLLQGCSVAEIVQGIRLTCDGGVVLSPLAASRVAERMKQQVPLTTRELEVLRQMMFGLSNKHMASALDLAVGTVKVHVKSVLRKLDAANRTHAVAVAQRRGLLSREVPTAPPRRGLTSIRRSSPVSSAPKRSQLADTPRPWLAYGERIPAHMSLALVKE
jgi:DNA-binding NarL/FixJ family response regulator